MQACYPQDSLLASALFHIEMYRQISIWSSYRYTWICVVISELSGMPGHSRQTLVPWREGENKQVQYLLLTVTQD